MTCQDLHYSERKLDCQNFISLHFLIFNYVFIVFFYLSLEMLK